ncbi:hypothetical protein LCGC14_2422110, partial [marine sediment metagenome]
EYNHIRPHISLDYRPPAPEVILPTEDVVVRFRSAPPHTYASVTNSRSGTKYGDQSKVFENWIQNIAVSFPQ